MAGFLPADGDLLQVRVVCYTPTQIALNILHYQLFTHGGAGLDLQALANFFSGTFEAAYKAYMGATAKFRGVGVLNLMAPQTVEYSSVVNDGVGTGGAGIAPTQVSGLISMKTLIRGRRYIGHAYPGFPAEAFIENNGAFSAAGLALLVDIATAMGPTKTFTSGANSSTLYQAIRHPDVVVAGVKVPQWTTVYVLAAAPLFATQRRRGQFGQTNLPPF